MHYFITNRLLEHTAFVPAGRIRGQVPLREAHGPDWQADPAARLGTHSAHHFGAAAAQVEDHAGAPEGGGPEARYHGAVYQARFLVAGKDPHREPRPLRDQPRHLGPVRGAAEGGGRSDQGMNGPEGPGSPRELGGEVGRSPRRAPVDQAAMAQAAAEATRVARPGHRLDIAAVRGCAGNVPD